MTDVTVKRFADVEALVDALAATLFADMARDPAGRAPSLMLSGGASPLALYERLAADPQPIDPALHVLYSDERMVDEGSRHSNHGNALPMLAAIGIPALQVLRPHPELGAVKAAATYDRELACYILNGAIVAAILGLGDDGHTASIFSLEDARRRDGLAFPVSRADFPRVSVSAPLLEQVERICFLVIGEAKKDILRRFLREPEVLPAGVAVERCQRVEVWTDLPEDA